MTEEKKFNPSCLPESALKRYSLLFEQRLAELNPGARPSRPTIGFIFGPFIFDVALTNLKRLNQILRKLVHPKLVPHRFNQRSEPILDNALARIRLDKIVKAQVFMENLQDVQSDFRAEFCQMLLDDIRHEKDVLVDAIIKPEKLFAHLFTFIFILKYRHIERNDFPEAFRNFLIGSKLLSVDELLELLLTQAKLNVDREKAAEQDAQQCIKSIHFGWHNRTPFSASGRKT
jgi:hypothetical protein